MNNISTEFISKSPVLQSNLQKHLTRCENVIRPLSLDAARQRLVENNSQRSMSIGSVGDDDEMERKIIALDYRIQLDQCMTKSI
mmetsp:Transcript_1487/g.2018  ORF Transcript_1487/g.2018 Transcript_1487/m.2018 type:complete len:84 (-) Transcript_1487:152-403(-)